MSSRWANNPGWFDEWIWERAMDGRLGSEIKAKVESGELEGCDLWAYDEDGSLAREADIAFCERGIE